MSSSSKPALCPVCGAVIRQGEIRLAWDGRDIHLECYDLHGPGPVFLPTSQGKEEHQDPWFPAWTWWWRPLWQRRLFGCAGYLLCALYALRFPAEVDRLVMGALDRQATQMEEEDDGD